MVMTSERGCFAIMGPKENHMQRVNHEALKALKYTQFNVYNKINEALKQN